jgi:DNA-binding beta-propeller fold protein YncE
MRLPERKTTILLGCAIVIGGAICCCVESRSSEPVHAAPLVAIRKITLPTMHDGDFDHFAVDLAGHRLFLAAEANGAVQVFDLQRNESLTAIPGFKEPHAILFREDVRRLYVVDGEDSAVKILDADTYKPLGAVALSIDADSMTYDPETRYMYVVNGGREAKTPYSLISVIDTSAGRKLLDIKVDDTNWLEGMALERAGHRLFVSMTGISAIGVLDRQKNTVVAKWKLPPNIQQNVALKLDEAHHRLFTVTRKPAAFVVLDSNNGSLIASLPCAPMVDDISYDSSTGRIYLAGDNAIDIIQQKDADHYSKIASLAGAFRAKTALLVPEWHRYYLAVPRHDDRGAEVRVFKVR